MQSIELNPAPSPFAAGNPNPTQIGRQQRTCRKKAQAQKAISRPIAVVAGSGTDDARDQ
jgi:hypothetical protein